MLKSKLWRSLQTTFQSLSKQQRRLDPDRWLRADCEYNRDGLSAKEQRLLQRGLWSLLDHPWVWRLKVRTRISADNLKRSRREPLQA